MTRNEAALFNDVQFHVPSDLGDDGAAMTLLVAVRDNDVKGRSVLDSLNIVAINGDPTTQHEHCLREPNDDFDIGNQQALDRCKQYIHDTTASALDGLDATGKVDPNKRIELAVYGTFAGRVHPALPLFYVRMGQALHALQDGFSHTYRTSDGLTVRAVLNFVELAAGTLDDERDGPPHSGALDDCRHSDPIIFRNVRLATQSSSELLAAALDPSLTREQKLAQVDVVLARYLTYQPGCTSTNEWCNAPEAKVSSVTSCNCRVGTRGSRVPFELWALLAAAFLWRRRRGAAAALVATLLIAVPAHADAPLAPPPPGEEEPPAPPLLPPQTAPNTPVPLPPPRPGDLPNTEQGKEPGRDIKTPTIKQIQTVREAKRLGPRWGFDASIGGSFSRPALAFVVGGRFRISEPWVVGLDVEWNPWIRTDPAHVENGSLNIYGSLIRRFPLKWERVNLRTTTHFGMSTLLFDVYGAPHHSTGIVFGASLLGLDFDLGGVWRVVFDPADILVPMPYVGQIPLYYEQYRFMLGVSFGG
jgi:MYXO-CTERM domain-containing protein